MANRHATNARQAVGAKAADLLEQAAFATPIPECTCAPPDDPCPLHQALESELLGLAAAQTLPRYVVEHVKVKGAQGTEVVVRYGGEIVPRVSYHSPDGLEYGYGGSGPADLALTILAHAFGLDGPDFGRQLRFGPHMPPGEAQAAAWRLHQTFKAAFIEPAARNAPLVILSHDVLAFLFRAVQEGVLRADFPVPFGRAAGRASQ